VGGTVAAADVAEIGAGAVAAGGDFVVDGDCLADPAAEDLVAKQI